MAADDRLSVVKFSLEVAVPQMYMHSLGGIHAQTKEQYFTFDFFMLYKVILFFSRSLNLLLYCCFFIPPVST